VFRLVNHRSTGITRITAYVLPRFLRGGLPDRRTALRLFTAPALHCFPPHFFFSPFACSLSFGPTFLRPTHVCGEKPPRSAARLGIRSHSSFPSLLPSSSSPPRFISLHEKTQVAVCPNRSGRLTVTRWALRGPGGRQWRQGRATFLWFLFR